MSVQMKHPVKNPVFLFRNGALWQHLRGYPFASDLRNEIGRVAYNVNPERLAVALSHVWSIPACVFYAEMFPCAREESHAVSLAFKNTPPGDGHLVHYCQATRQQLVDEARFRFGGNYQASTIRAGWSTRGLRVTPVRFEPRPWPLRPELWEAHPDIQVYDPTVWDWTQESPFDFTCPRCQAPVCGLDALFAPLVPYWQPHRIPGKPGTLQATYQALCQNWDCRQAQARKNKRERSTEAVLLALGDV